MATFKRNALGRGLDALITMDEVKTEGSSSINEIELSRIYPNPDQPRREFDPDGLAELASSIRELGIIQPISLRQTSDGSYQIIAGERRFRAATMAGLKSVPAYVRTAEDETMIFSGVYPSIALARPFMRCAGWLRRRKSRIWTIFGATRRSRAPKPCGISRKF